MSSASARELTRTSTPDCWGFERGCTTHCGEKHLSCPGTGSRAIDSLSELADGMAAAINTNIRRHWFKRQRRCIAHKLELSRKEAFEIQRNFNAREEFIPDIPPEW